MGVLIDNPSTAVGTGEEEKVLGPQVTGTGTTTGNQTVTSDRTGHSDEVVPVSL